MSITFSQIKKLHTLKAMLGIDDELYREMLGSFDVQTCKNLTQAEAEILIEILAQKQINKNKEYKKRYKHLQDRDDEMATPLQLRKIEAMWTEICDAQNREKALRTFIQNKFKISDMRFVTNISPHR